VVCVLPSTRTFASPAPCSSPQIPGNTSLNMLQHSGSWSSAREYSRLLEFSERRFHLAMLDAAPVGVAIVAKGRVIGNAAFHKLFGSPPTDSDPTLDEVFPSEDPALKEVKAAIAAVRRNGGGSESKVHLNHKGGRYRVSIALVGSKSGDQADVVLWMEDLVRARIMLVNGDDETFYSLAKENYDVLRAQTAMNALILTTEQARSIDLWVIDIARPSPADADKEELKGLPVFTGAGAKILFIVEKEEPVSSRREYKTLLKTEVNSGLRDKVQEILAGR
jgi:hypothetical protein